LTSTTVLEPLDVLNLSTISRRFLAIARDNNLWKTICFEHSRAEARRRRQQLESRMAPHLAELARAVSERTAVPGVHDSSAPSAELSAHKIAMREKQRALANWDPSYPGESVNFYEEYIARHAPITTSWLQPVHMGTGEDRENCEATGLGLLYEEGSQIADKVIAPLEDGSIGVWNLNFETSEGVEPKPGAIIDRSASGVLAGQASVSDRHARLAQSRANMTETGAVECVSVDSRQRKAYFGVQNTLNEVDLNTLQVVSCQDYPFPITALSEARHPTPVTVGTNMTIHLHDPREKPCQERLGDSVRCELIGGTAPSGGFDGLASANFGQNYATLSQPGPLSILHLPDREWDGNGDIWVCGRFTSLLNYDRRFFPRLRGTVHSGARLSSTTLLPFPFIPRNLGFHSIFSSNSSIKQSTKSLTGHTIVAAGEYKGKGSLELFGLSPDPAHTILSSDNRSAVRNRNACIQNRQTASRSKLLSVAAHGARLVYSDGDGWVKWIERDGFTPVRQFSINPEPRTSEDGSASVGGLFSTPHQAHGEGDIVQKILPTLTRSQFGNQDLNAPLNHDNLVVWTGDGRIGLVGFGRGEKWRTEDFEERAETEEQRQREQEEREYAGTMRRALERQAADVRFVRGFGLGSAMW
ncbi:hypothetical protein K490DRAFT_33891, partial [Saccharata proteae CBS 121410]